MDNILPSIRLPSLSNLRELVLPKEHGSWSLAFEPIVFGLIAVPSVAGGWLAIAVVAAFFARRPLRIAWRDARPERRREARVALATCALGSLGAMVVAVALGGPGWMIWLVPSALAGALFLSFDLRNGGREETAEIAGSTAFALLPAAMAALGGATPAQAAALALVMCGRAVPAVLCVRAALRGTKGGTWRPAPALATAFAALAVGVMLVRNGLAPVMAVAAFGILALRTFGLLVFPRPAFRARTLGMIEALLGVAFVVAVAIAWRG